MWACASIQAQNAHFLPTTTTITQLMKMTMETSEEVSTGQEVKGKSSFTMFNEMQGAI